jgi:uncharacterized repeat protein (TIGR02543 family)
MKFKITLLIALTVLVSKIGVGQIYTNTFTGASACPTNGNTPTMATNSTGTAVSRTTMTCNSTNNVFNSTTLNATSSISNTSYIEFSATANAGYILNLTSVSFFRQGSNTAPNKIEVRYSTDGFATSTSWGLAPVTPTSGSVLTWDFTDFSTAAAGTVRFRIYPFGVTRCDGNATAASSGGTFRVDDVTINGTVTSAITTYSNTYNGNGNTSGTVPVDAASPYVSGATVTVLGNTGTLARTGYTFAGWNTLANGSGTDRAAGSSFTISANTTLFAKWTANSNTITFDGNGSTGGSTAAQNINTAASANLTANGFIRAGYTFAGWNTLANGTGTSYTDQVAYTMGTANVTLYAQWTANSLTVTYDSQGGSAISNGSTTTGGTVSNPGNPTRSGYSFNGWFVASSGGSAISFPYTHGQTANFTLYAQWTVVSTPTINPVTLATALSTTYGTASSDASFTASGSNLSVNITADAQTGFEVSTDNSNFGSSVSVSSGTMVYVRFTATQVAGSHNSSTAVVLSSTGAISQNVTTSATGNNVLAKDLTITGISISNKTYDGNTTASISGTAAYSGLVNGQSFPVTGSPSASFNNKNAGTAKPITVSGYTAPSANYSITQPTGLTADITAKSLTVASPTVTSKSYDGNTNATVTGTLSVVESGDVVILIGTGTFATANVGTAISVTSIATLSGADAGNYSLTQPTGLFGDITLKSLTITASDVSKEMGVLLTGGPGSTAFASSGLAGSETIGSVTITYGAAAGTSGQGAIAGTYSGQVTPSAATGGTFNISNYSITYSSGAIIVAGFTAGNLVVERIGNGSTVLSNAASTINLVELNTSGTTIQTLGTIFTGSNLLTESGSATSNGFLNSYNTFLGVPGYNSALGTLSVASLNTKATNLIGTGASVTSRAVFPTGGPSVTPPSPFSGNNFRSVVPISSTAFYASGTASGTPNTGGVWYFDGTGLTQISSTTTGQPVNCRNVEVYNNQLYLSSSTGTYLGISKLGTGLPTSSNQTATLEINMGAGASPYGFVLSPDGNTMYVADDRTTASGGIYKFTKSGGTWSQAYLLGTGVSSIGARGLMVDFSGSDPIIYATTGETAANRIIKITDTGSGSSSTTLATAAANYIFRGVDFTPAAAPSEPIIGTITQPTCATATGSVELTGLPSGQWRIYGFPSGSAVGTGSSTTISGLSTGSYTFIVTSYTGRTSVASASVTVDAQPATPSAPTASNQSFCAMNNPTVSDLTTTSGSNIQWYTAATGGSALTSVSSVSTGTYYFSQTQGACESSRASVTIAVDNINLTVTPTTGDLIWNGKNTSDYGTMTNWYEYNGSTFVNATVPPSSSTNIIIPANQSVCVLQQPNTLTNNTSAKNIHIETGASLTMQTGTITIDGNWENKGTFIPGTGTVSFIGMSNQTITNAADETFNILTINKASGDLLLSNDVSINNQLNLTKGLIDLQASNLILSTNIINGGSATSYVRTSGVGVLKRAVSNSPILFPVGKSNYNPATITNNGVSDVFSVRVYDYVSSSGVEGGTQTAGDVVNRTWMVDEELLGGSNVTLRMHWNTGEEANAFVYSPGFMNVMHFNGSVWEELGSTNQSNSPYNFVETTGIATFSPFAIGMTGSALPVEFLEFTATCNEANATDLKWSTASEHNSDYFKIEKSTNGINWSMLAKVVAAGNATERMDYSFEDTEKTSGAYYKLWQYDVDGTANLLATVQENCFGSNPSLEPLVYPNPITDQELMIELRNNKVDFVTVQIYSMQGTLVYAQHVKATEQITLSKLNINPGIYQLILQPDAYETKIVKICIK